MAAYADYAFYTTTYLGAAIASADFARLALRASAKIDQITFGRTAVVMESEDEADADTQEKIQSATCAIAEEIQKLEAAGGAVKSERVGNQSVEYLSVLSDDERMIRAAKVFLWDTDLMYRGFNEDER